MSINLDGRGWRCWRVPAQHYGRSPVGLIQRLVGCTTDEAKRIVYGEGSPPPPPQHRLAEGLAKLRGEDAPAPTRVTRSLEMPRNFHPLDDDPRADPFWEYLIRRGYRESEARWLASTYDLRWTTTGHYKWRLIFPVYDRWRNLLTWTARTISSEIEPRYKQPRTDDVITEAPRTLYGLDVLWDAPYPRVLVLCEGPLDATRIAVTGAPLGVYATCLFGLGMTADQRDLVMTIAPRFECTALLLDPAARLERLRMGRALAPLELLLPELPATVKDPGDLTATQTLALCWDLLAEADERALP